jgi:hypothetical protein
MFLYIIILGLRLDIRKWYKLKKVHMTVAPPVTDKIVTTFAEIKSDSNLKQYSIDV